MPICIECRYPVNQLYTTYSRADDRALGRGVRLTICPRCKKFADKYVEHDFVVLFIDLVLIKPQVYRHLLFNRLGRENDGFDPAMIRLSILLLLFDVYLTWARVEQESSAVSSTDHAAPETRTILTYPLLLQYTFFLGLCAAQTLAFHLPIRLLARHLCPPPSPSSSSSPRPSSPSSTDTPHPNRISTALVVSSCSKLFPVLMVIWDYDLPSSAGAVSWAVIINNVAALEILLDCGYARAAALAGVGAACRWSVGAVLLAGAGLGGLGVSAGPGLGAGLGVWRGMSWEGDGGLAGVMGAVGREVGKLVGLA